METARNAAGPAQATPRDAGVPTTDHTIVGRVETSAAILGQIFVRTTRGALVRVSMTPLTVLRSRRRRGLAWSETKFVRLQDVKDGDRVMVKGTPTENGWALRANLILVGDIARFLWCSVLTVVDGRQGLLVQPREAAPLELELPEWARIREFAYSNALSSTRAPHARPEPILDERSIDRLSHVIAATILEPGDTVLALVEPTPTLGRPLATLIVRLPPAQCA
jgi:hypothetical protein